MDDQKQKLKKLFTEQDFRESENGNSEILAHKIFANQRMAIPRYWHKGSHWHNPSQKQEMALQCCPTIKKTSVTFIPVL